MKYWGTSDLIKLPPFNRPQLEAAGLGGGDTPNLNTRFARILRVDFIRRVVDVEFVDTKGFWLDVAIGGTGGGKRSNAGEMPVVGSLCLVDFIRFGNTKSGFLRTLLPVGYQTGLEAKPYRYVKGEREERLRQRVHHPGEHFIDTHEGANFRQAGGYESQALDLTTSAGTEKGEVIHRGVQRYKVTDAGRSWEGMAVRDNVETNSGPNTQLMSGHTPDLPSPVPNPSAPPVNPADKITPSFDSTKTPFGSTIQSAAAASGCGLDPQLLACLLKQESGFNPNVTSMSGAAGIGQFMGETAVQMGLRVDRTADMDFYHYNGCQVYVPAGGLPSDYYPNMASGMVRDTAHPTVTRVVGNAYTNKQAIDGTFVDERFDPTKAIPATAKYLCQNYRSLAASGFSGADLTQATVGAYNAGLGSIQGAQRQAGGSSSWDAVRSQLPPKTVAGVSSYVNSISGCYVTGGATLPTMPPNSPNLGAAQRHFQRQGANLPEGRTLTGERTKVVTLDGNDMDAPTAKTKPVAEKRFIVEELGTGHPKLAKELGETDLEFREAAWREDPFPIIEGSSGNLVGSDPYVEPHLYGEVLYQQLYKDTLSVGDEGNPDKPNLMSLSYNSASGFTSEDHIYEKPIKSIDERLRIGVAFAARMRNPKSGYTFFGLSKSGNVVAHLGRSADIDPMGEGRSLDCVMEGSLRFVLGRNTKTKLSAELETRGGAAIHLGSISDPVERFFKLNKSSGKYGAYGYHDITKTADMAPLNSPSIANPSKIAKSLDFLADKNIHLIIGEEEGTSVVLDSQGKVLLALGKDHADRSLLAGLDGSVGMVIGKDSDGRSVDIETAGRIQMHVLSGGPNEESIHLEFATGGTVIIDAPAADGYALKLKMRGSFQQIIEGKKLELYAVLTESVSETLKAPTISRYIEGKVTEIITGDYTQHVIGDRSMTTSGSKLYD